MSETSLSNDEIRAQVVDWLDEHWDPDLPVEEWWRMVGDAGWTVPHFTPEQGGRGLPRRAFLMVRSLFHARGALRPPGGLGLLMAAPTILTQGTPDQVERFVTPILRGEVGWCQLFSEPGAGSDLAGLATRARRDGDHWVITGQKVWSSEAHKSDYGMLLARTDPDVPKHAGISWFAFKLDQPGVTIRPLREMTGHAVFNEVFIDEAVCPVDDLVGGEGNGWAVCQTTLFFERTGIGAGGGHAGFPYPGPKGGMLGRRAGDAALDVADSSSLMVSLPELLDLVRRTGRGNDPVIRQKLARLVSFAETGKWNALRAKAEVERGGGQSITSIGKIAQTRIVKLTGEIAMDVLGAGGTLAGADGLDDGHYAEAFVFSPASSIYGGADEIQRNIISERTLGLPRDERPDKGLSWAEAQRRLAAEHG